MSIIEIESEKQFNELVAKHDNVIVDFYAGWCGTCKQLADTFNDVKTKYPKATILKVNVDEEDLEEIVANHKLGPLPHVVSYHKGKQEAGIIQFLL